jgi:hypothetical protein
MCVTGLYIGDYLLEVTDRTLGTLEHLQSIDSASHLLNSKKQLTVRLPCLLKENCRKQDISPFTRVVPQKHKSPQREKCKEFIIRKFRRSRGLYRLQISTKNLKT